MSRVTYVQRHDVVVGDRVDVCPKVNECCDNTQEVAQTRDVKRREEVAATLLFVLFVLFGEDEHRPWHQSGGDVTLRGGGCVDKTAMKREEVGGERGDHTNRAIEPSRASCRSDDTHRTRTGRDINTRILPGRSALGLRYVRYAVRSR